MNGKLTAEDSDDAFDIADAAIEKMIAGDFQPVSSGSFLFADPVFQDLVSALDIPTPAGDTIFDPERNV